MRYFTHAALAAPRPPSAAPACAKRARGTSAGTPPSAAASMLFSRAHTHDARWGGAHGAAHGPERNSRAREMMEVVAINLLINQAVASESPKQRCSAARS